MSSNKYVKLTNISIQFGLGTAITDWDVGFGTV